MLAFFVQICYVMYTVNGYILAIWASVSTNHRKWLTTGFPIDPVASYFFDFRNDGHKQKSYLEDEK